MRTSDICPTCATFINAACVLYNGPTLETLNIPTLTSLEDALILINTWAETVSQGGGTQSTKQVFNSTLNQQAFTLNSAPNNVDVWINGVLTQDYTLNNFTLTLDSAPLTGSEVVVRKY